MANARGRKRTQKKTLPEDLANSLTTFSKAHGDGILMSPRTSLSTNVIPTGVFLLDLALNGGWQHGKHAMNYGYANTAKSTLFLNGVREFQRKYPDQYVLWVDTEGLYDQDWAEKIGVDLDRLVVSQPDYGELAVDIIEDMIQRPSIGLIVLDSIPACVPMKVLEKSAEDATVGVLAALMGKLCSKITSTCSKERRKGHIVTVWQVNQLRDKIGVMYGSTRSLPGGRQINHVPTTKVWNKLVKEHMTKDEYGNDVSDFLELGFQIEKSKCGSSIREGRFSLNLNPNGRVNEGCSDDVDTVFSFAKKFKVVRGGAKKYKLLTLAGGDFEGMTFEKHDSIIDFLYENPDELDTLCRSIIMAHRMSRGLPALPPDGYLVSPNGRVVQIEQQSDKEEQEDGSFDYEGEEEDDYDDE